MSKFPLETIKHSAAHVMAAAVKELFPEVKFDIGPATDDGFYYDFDMEHRLVPEDLKKIEGKINRHLNMKFPFEYSEMNLDDAEEFLKSTDQSYKLQRLSDIPDGETISFYKCGDFTDLCCGPHVEHTGQIGVIKLTSIAGSYFKGKETNPMLQRVYGIAFPTKKELKSYLLKIEEAKKRDHRKLGKELGLFSMSDQVGPGLVLWHPKGARIRTTIEDFWRNEHFKSGYDMLYTPHIGKSDLWKKSGHLDFYSDAMYTPMNIDDCEYYAKPMNCPFHIEIYNTGIKSYRELPLRWAELGTVYRYEKSGVLHGLLRVRGFTQDDAHIICTPEQVEDEIAEVLRFSLEMWKAFGFDEIKAYLATKPAKSVGPDDRWEQALVSLQNAVEKAGLKCELDEGGGAFYGPKIDLKIKDAIGREWQTSTIQFDFNLPERFDMTYVGDDGKRHRPYMIHRALFGSLERFFAILIEHYSGAFPLWLAPEQIRVMPITEDQLEYAKEITASLRKTGFRVEADTRSGTIGSKIKDARNDRIQYMAIVGEREAEAKTIAVRSRREGQLGAIELNELISKMNGDIKKKV